MPQNNRTVLTVSQLNSRAAMIVQSAESLRNVYVRGKLVKWSYYGPQNAYYYALEDNSGTGRLEGVLFNASERNTPREAAAGKSVIANGFIEVYNKGGYNRIRTTRIEIDDNAYEEETFEERRDRLDALGYFRQKRPIPKPPKKICLITSEIGEAKHDFLCNIERRWPMVEVLFIPSGVMSDNAVDELISAIELANTTDADLIVFGRGGGDKEKIDKVFNDVRLADAILASRIPTLSAVGHERNNTIADFVADKHVTSPTGAIMEVFPDKADKIADLEAKKKAVYVALKSALDRKVVAVDLLGEKIKGKSPMNRLKMNSQKLDAAAEKLKIQMNNLLDHKASECAEKYSRIRLANAALLDRKERSLIHAAEIIEAVNPLKVLLRGYSITYNGDKALKSVDEINAGDKLRIKLSDGIINAVAESTEKE
ncbi:MAG: exodeoxyribonuclease VII large subunit [Ruminiclostridium sp.]|nr:exodeoxyribonuclease VII large subunit [Ruminiclostridium sp.]